MWKKKPKKKNLFPEKESKVAEWNRIKRTILNPKFEEWGLYYTCELRYEGCLGSILNLQYAHSKKRVDIAKDGEKRLRDMCEVVRACTVCHSLIEHIPKDEGGKGKMEEIVKERIEARDRRLGIKTLDILVEFSYNQNRN